MGIKNNLKAALYIRVSTEEQAIDGLSPSAQAETLKQYCSAFAIEVFDIFMDLGLSGKSLKNRNELKRLIEACGRKQFDMVLVWKISRLSRNLKDLLYLIDVFERYNVHFTSCSEKFDTSTPVGRMTLQLLGSIAEFERNTIVENVKLGLMEFARKGGKASSVLGYDNIDKKLVVNEGEAKIVKLIFSLYTESDMNYSAISKYLNSLGIRTKRGSEYRGSNISYIIHNPVYIGINRHSMNTENEYSVQGIHSAIIDSEQWDKAQNKSSKLNRRASGDTSNCSSSFLKVNCKKCNFPMRVFYSYSRGKKYKYLRCCNCSNYLNYEKLTKAVSEAIIEAIDDKSLQKEVLGLIRKDSAAFGTTSIEIASLESEIKRLQKSKARYLSLFENYKIADSRTFVDRIAEIDIQIEQLKKKMLKLGKTFFSISETPDCEDYLAKLKTGILENNSDVLKQLSACLVKSIEAYKGEINIALYL